MDRGQIVREYALDSLGSRYVYGGSGQMCTPRSRERQLDQYPGFAEAIKKACPRLSGARSSCAGCRYQGRRLYDCAQLVRRAFGAAGIVLPSGASSQWKKGSWAFKGPLDQPAFQQVCVLFRASGAVRYPMRHAGISLGDGRVVDARGHREGVVISRMGDYPWTHYALPAGMADEMLPAALMPGSVGLLVRDLQERLMRLGFPLPRFGADGRFGRETAAALIAFQRWAGLAPTGQGNAASLAMIHERTGGNK